MYQSLKNSSLCLEESKGGRKKENSVNRGSRVCPSPVFETKWWNAYLSFSLMSSLPHHFLSVLVAEWPGCIYFINDSRSWTMSQTAILSPEVALHPWTFPKEKYDFCPSFTQVDAVTCNTVVKRRGETAWCLETESISLTVRTTLQRDHLVLLCLKNLALRIAAFCSHHGINFLRGEKKSLLVRTVQGDPKGLEFKQQKKCEQQQRMLGEIMLVLSEEKRQRFKNECSWIFWCLAQFPERNYGQLQLRTKHYSVVCSWIF